MLSMQSQECGFVGVEHPDGTVNLGDLTRDVADRLLGRASPQSDDSGAYSDDDTASFHSAHSFSTVYSDARSHPEDTYSALSDEEEFLDVGVTWEGVRPIEHPENDAQAVTAISDNIDAGTTFFDNLEEIHANPYAYCVTKKGEIKKIGHMTFFEKLSSLVKKVADKFFGVDQFAKITNAFLEKHAGEQGLLRRCFETSNTAGDYAFLTKISNTSGKMGELVGHIMLKAEPSVGDIEELKMQVTSMDAKIAATEELIREKREAIAAFSEEERFTPEGSKRLEALESELLEAIEELPVLREGLKDDKEHFANVRESEHPEHRALTKRYYQDRVERNSGQFTVNGNTDDLAGLWAFAVEHLDNDEQWIKTLELILTQEAYVGFSNLPMAAGGSHVAFGRKCDVTMTKEGDEVVVTTAFPVVVKKDVLLSKGITLRAQKEYRFRKEGGKVQLVAHAMALV